jgi:hypothetical protein
VVGHFRGKNEAKFNQTEVKRMESFISASESLNVLISE